jgi:hypothetical protein
MLNTRLLGGEGVRFFSIVLVPYLSRASRSEILEHKKGGRRFCSFHSCHNVKDNSIVSAHFFVLAFHNEKKRKKYRSHLLVGFSIVLGFP